MLKNIKRRMTVAVCTSVLQYHCEFNEILCICWVEWW